MTELGKSIIRDFSPVPVRYSGSAKEGYSVLLQDENSDFSVWMDVYIDSLGDVISDWNKYIFFDGNSIDMLAKEVQVDCNVFMSAADVSLAYMQSENLIFQLEDGTFSYSKNELPCKTN